MPDFGSTRIYCGEAYEKTPKFEFALLDNITIGGRVIVCF
jgi:hypothetical protein